MSRGSIRDRNYLRRVVLDSYRIPSTSSSLSTASKSLGANGAISDTLTTNVPNDGHWYRLGYIDLYSVPIGLAVSTIEIDGVALFTLISGTHRRWPVNSQYSYDIKYGSYLHAHTTMPASGYNYYSIHLNWWRL